MFTSFIKKWEENEYASYFVVAAMFSIPLSPSLKSIFFILAGSAILLTSTYRRSLSFVVSQNWCRMAFFFLAVVILGCFWTASDHHTGLMFIEKYSKLLYLPIFAMGFQSRKVRMLGIYAFILAMTVTCIISVSGIGPINTKGMDLVDPGHVFYNHIITTFMMSFAAFLSGLFVIRKHGLQRILFSLLMLLFSYQILFVNKGRSGYVILFVLVLLLLALSLSWKQFIAAAVCFCVLFAFSVKTSTVCSERLQQIVTEYNKYKHGEKDSDIGFRLMFHEYSKSLFLSSPFFGLGTGGFSHEIKLYNPWPTRADMIEPHSQYWLVAVEQGLLGLVALFGFFASLLIAAFRLHEMKAILLGMLVAFALANLSDSLLAFSAVGNLFIMFSALCLGELVGAKEYASKESLVDEGEISCVLES
jgi:O-antigen ligase